MNHRKLGRTNLRVSEIGFGGWAIGGDVPGQAWGSYGPVDDDASRLAILRALDLGVTVFDTADVYGYGHSETLLGEVIDTWPGKDRVVIITKGGINFYRDGEAAEPDFTPYAIANAVEHSRARLRRETLDVYLLMNPPIALLTERTHVRDSLTALQRAGKIGAAGVSMASISDAEVLLASDFPLDVIEIPFNLFDQSAVLSVIPAAEKRQIGLLAREPLANGFLTGKYGPASRFADTDLRSGMPPQYRAALFEASAELTSLLHKPGRSLAQAALRFVLDERGVSAAIPGAKTAEQVEENVHAADTPPITDDERIAIHRVFFPE
jgi:aryl-alcohol dehydrogenase-like predicted oxidoreductase